MELSVVRGEDWEENPEKAKKQIRKARFWSAAFMLPGIVFILHVCSGEAMSASLLLI